jgi:hypothetical protein
MLDDRLIDEASGVADRRPATTASTSEGIRLLDRIGRMFASAPGAAPDSGHETLFVWGTLEVRRLLGAGSFGEVYQAWDPALRRDVALKLRNSETGALRWLDEARNLARVRHPHVLTVHGADVLGGRAGIWTERVIGRTLEEELEASGPFAEAEALRIGRDIAAALDAVHAAGLIHGDVKTSNIMLEEGDAPRRSVLVDFGSADHLPDAGEIPAYVAGTPLTMAPEVLDGKPASPAADVYGLGATIFRLLTGRYPVEATSIDELRRAHRSETRARVRDFAPQVSSRFARAVERALEPDPAARWPTAKSFARVLDDSADPTRRIRMRAAAIGAGVAVLAAVVFIAFLVLRPGAGPISRGRLARPLDTGAFVQVWRHPGPETSSAFGYVTALVDLDHDGFSDIVAAEPNWRGSDGAYRGRVLVFRGSAQGPAQTPAWTFAGDEPDAQCGYQVANAGDTDGNKIDELLISQEARDPGQMLPRVRLFKLDASTRTLVPVWSYAGAVRDAGTGRGMSSAGDVNGDGFGDVVISEYNAPDLKPGEGRVLLFMGSPHGLDSTPAWSVRGEQEGACMGTYMRRLGDVNGDGFDDVIVAAQSWDGPNKPDCGRAMVYLGSVNGPAANPVLTVEGALTNSFFGNTAGGAGDVNHDGYADVLISEPRYTDDRYPERGRILLFLGGAKGPSKTPDWQMLGPVSYAHYGTSFDALGDIDGDGFDDIVVSSEQYSEGKRTHIGMIEVFRGSRQGLETKPLWRALGDTPDCHFGLIVAAADVNGDGVVDIVAGAPLWGDSVPESGLLVAYLHRLRNVSSK